MKFFRKKPVMILSIIDMMLAIVLVVSYIFTTAATAITTEYRSAKSAKIEAEEETSLEEAAETETAEVADVAEVAEITADSERGEITTTNAETTEEATEATEAITEEAELAEETTEEVKAEEYAYSNTITDEETESVIQFFEEAPDVDEDEYFDFVKEHMEYLQDYALDPEGYLLIPLSEESLRQTDEERPLASVNMGLNKKPINDAVAFPFSLSEEQIKKVLAAKAGQKVDFSEEEIKALRAELFMELAENPVLFEAWMKLVTAQKIGQKTTVLESWPSGQEYIKKMEIARDLEPYDGLDPYEDIRGRGNNIWLRKVRLGGPNEPAKNYTSPEYQKYVLDVVLLLYPAETDVEVLTAKAGDHYNLVPGEKNSLRFAQPANYKETLASLVFKIYTKDGRLAIKFGANLRDKRPEVLNYTVTRKPVPPSKKTEDKKPDPPTQATTTVVPATTYTTPPGGSNPPGNNPPNTTPPETKSPADDKANSETDHKDDDQGPGTKKEDIGDSKSDKVEDSQYTQGTSVNTDGANPDQYNQGPAADSTDNGTVPDTSAPENQIGTGEGVVHDNYVDPNAGNTQVNTSEEKPAGKMSSAPAVE